MSISIKDLFCFPRYWILEIFCYFLFSTKTNHRLWNRTVSSCGPSGLEPAAWKLFFPLKFKGKKWYDGGRRNEALFHLSVLENKHNHNCSGGYNINEQVAKC